MNTTPAREATGTAPEAARVATAIARSKCGPRLGRSAGDSRIVTRFVAGHSYTIVLAGNGAQRVDAIIVPTAGFSAPHAFDTQSTSPPMTATTDPVQLVTEKGCIGCHVLEGKGGAVGPPFDRMGGQRGQIDGRLGELAAQLAQGDSPVRALEAERQAALEERVSTEKALGEARAALEGIDNALRGYEQTRHARDEQALAQREKINQR